MRQRALRASNDVRIGPVSVLALIAILSMAVLAVLAVSTANASLSISQRQASAVEESYLAEMAAQDFVAGMDAAAEGLRGDAAARAVERSMDELLEHASAAAGGLVTGEATVDGRQVRADFACSGARTLSVSVSVRDDGRLYVDEWRMTAIQNQEEPAGALWTGA